MEMYFKCQCLKCDKRNFVYSGDPSDLTGVDPEGFICWNCKQRNTFDEDGNLLDITDDNMLPPEFYDLGLEKI